MARRIKAALMAASAFLATGAYAQTWDAFSSFSLRANEDPSSPFRYVVGGRLASLKDPACSEGASICLLDADIAFAGVYKPLRSGEWLTIGLDPTSLFLHPAYFEPAAIVFTAPSEGTYRFSGGFRIVDHYPTGVIVSWGNGHTRLSQPAQSTSFSYEKHLAAGEAVSFSVDPDGDYGYDSTGVAVQATYLGSDAPAWQAGQWGAWSTTCGSATRTRAVTCVNPRTGAGLSETSCQALPKPDATETSVQTPGCSYEWKPEPWGSPAPACGATISSRTVSCVRSDGAAATDDQCAAAERPAIELATTDYSTCSHSWSVEAWSAPSSTCGQTVQNRGVTCQRSDGQPAEDASCPAGERPASQRAVSDYSACGFSWEAGSWSSPTRTCGSATRTRDVTCRRSDGTTAADTSCGPDRPETTESVIDYSTCTASWRYSEWSTPAPACGATVSTRTAECVREDGVTIDGSACGGRESLSRAETDYGTCSFSWRTSPWTTPAACGMTTRTRTVTCIRSDGRSASEDQCEAATRPASSEPVSNMSACRYDWVQTGIGAWSTCQNGSQSRSVDVQCRRSDGSAAADRLCPGSRPASLETRSCGTPDPTPQPGQEGNVVIFRRQMSVRP